MPQTPQELSDIAVRHQVYLEGLKTHEVKKNQKFLKDIDKIAVSYTHIRAHET